MKVLRSESFSKHGDLVKFAAKYNIQKEDIIFITADYGGFVLFFYA